MKTQPILPTRALYFSTLLLLSSLLVSTPTHANDSAFSGVGGTPKPMKGEHPSIVMQSEKVLIVSGATQYDTTVDFIFRNDGPATTVQMGFPESSYGDSEAFKKSAFLRFATYVDGQKVAAKRIVVGEQGVETEAFWLKTVSFGRNQTRKIRVAYRSPMGGTTMWGMNRALVYDFTGKNWKGKVERSDLEVRVNAPGLWIGLPHWDGQPLAMTFKSEPQAGVFRKTWRNWQAQGGFSFGLTPTVPFWMWDRATLPNSLAPVATFRSARTFRVGPVPQELPTNVLYGPPAFTRNGVTFVALSHLKNRLEGFAEDLEKYRKVKTLVDLTWDAKTKSSFLTAGQTTLQFSEGDHKILKGTMPILTLSSAPFVLRGEYNSTLYVPLAPVAKLLGLEFKLMPQERLFELTRGRWDGK